MGSEMCIRDRGYAGPVSLLLPGERYAGRPSWPEERALEVLRGGAE